MNLYEHYLVINVALHVCNIVIKLLLAAHRIIQSVSGILNVVHVYVRWKDMMNWFVVFVLIPNELSRVPMMVWSKRKMKLFNLTYTKTTLFLNLFLFSCDHYRKNQNLGFRSSAGSTFSIAIMYSNIK